MTKLKDISIFDLLKNLNKSVIFESYEKEQETELSKSAKNNDEQALEKGVFLGAFFKMINEFDIKKIGNSNSDLYDMSLSYDDFSKSVETANEKRILKAKECISKIADLKEEMHVLEDLKLNNCIPLRITYSDFNKSNLGLKSIENLDSKRINKDIIHYSFGESVRTICCSVNENDKKLKNVKFNIDSYLAYKKGFLLELEDILTSLEIKTLDLSVKTMLFMKGLRFLTDYLKNDMQYNVTYKDQNLNRAKNQFKLLESFIDQKEDLRNNTKIENLLKENDNKYKRMSLKDFLEEVKIDHQISI